MNIFNSISLAVFVSLVVGSVQAEYADESWVARYNGTTSGKDRAFILGLDMAGNAYVGGFSEAGGANYNYTLLKYDPNGNVVWVADYDGPAQGPDWMRSMAVDDKGSTVVTGFSAGLGTGFDFATLKYDSQGNRLWVQRYDGPAHQNDHANALAIDNDGNVYVTGESQGTNGVQEAATVKYGPNGRQLWVRRSDLKEGSLILSDIAVDSARNVYVAGTQTLPKGNADFVIVKFDADGQQLWSVKRDWGANDQARFIALDAAGNAYVAGSSLRTSIGGKEYRHEDIGVIKLSPDGVELWSASIDSGFGNNEIPADLHVDAAGNVYVAGTKYGTSAEPSNITTADFIAYSFDPDGKELWSAHYAGPGGSRDTVSAAALDDGGAYYLFGAESSAPGGDLLLVTVKFNAVGDGQWVATHTGVDSGLSGSLAVDRAKNVWIAGSDKSGRDFLTIKYMPSTSP